MIIVLALGHLVGLVGLGTLMVILNAGALVVLVRREKRPDEKFHEFHTRITMGDANYRKWRAA